MKLFIKYLYYKYRSSYKVEQLIFLQKMLKQLTTLAFFVEKWNQFQYLGLPGDRTRNQSDESR